MEEQRRKIPTVAEEAEKSHKFWKRNLLWTVLVFAAILIYSFFTSSQMLISARADYLNITDPNGVQRSVPYSEITEAELVTAPDYGECVEGEDAKKWKSGTWRNAEWGEYYLCVYNASESCVVLTTEQGNVVVNLASDAETDSLYRAILARMD